MGICASKTETSAVDHDGNKASDMKEQHPTGQAIKEKVISNDNDGVATDPAGSTPMEGEAEVRHFTNWESSWSFSLGWMFWGSLSTSLRVHTCQSLS